MLYFTHILTEFSDVNVGDEEMQEEVQLCGKITWSR